MNTANRTLVLLAAAALACANVVAEQMSLRLDRDLKFGPNLERDQPAGFWERLEHAFDQRAREVFADRLSPPTVAEWIWNQPGTWPEILERGNRAVRAALAKSIEYSFRDASLALPLAARFQASQDPFSALLRDSVDAVEEEAVSPLDPMYRTVERLWWQNLAENHELRYGLKPFRANPYVFLSLRVKEADQLILLGHIRYYYHHFSDHRFELALSLPAVHGVTVDVGTAYQFGRHEDQKRLVVKLFKPLHGGGIVHVGIEVQKRPSFFAAISLPL